MASKGSQEFLDRIARNETILIAEGYLFEFKRRGRLREGSLVPEVVMDSPEVVKLLHQEFVDAGSDVVQAFTYYTHRAKMRLIGREDDLEPINRKALEVAKEVATANNKLFAGGLCNSNTWDPDDPESIIETESMMREQAQWAKEAGVDYMIAETFWDYGEASLALKILKELELPSVIMICPVGLEGKTFDGVTFGEACRKLKEEGADVVGLNCARGPRTMIPLMKEIRSVYKGPLACNPICYRTDEKAPTFSRFKYVDEDCSCYPHDVQIFHCSHKDIRWFAEQCQEIGIQSVGLCCGNDPGFFKTLTESYGRQSMLSKYKSDLSKNVFANENPDSRNQRLAKFAGLS